MLSPSLTLALLHAKRYHETSTWATKSVDSFIYQQTPFFLHVGSETQVGPLVYLYVRWGIPLPPTPPLFFVSTRKIFERIALPHMALLLFHLPLAYLPKIPNLLRRRHKKHHTKIRRRARTRTDAAHMHGASSRRPSHLSPPNRYS